MVATLVPPPDALPDVLPTARLTARGMPVRELRDELRRIPTARNVIVVASAFAQTVGVVIAAAWLDTWWAYLLAFAQMGRGHCQLNILGHEAAHRLLFPNQRANDLVGRFVLAYPTFQAFSAYRRAHFAHHRDELGPDEPDLALYRGYPLTRASLRRKLTRDLLFVSAWKNWRGLFGAARRRSREAWQILAVQAVLAGVASITLRPLAYVVWIAAWGSLWKVSNRLRSLAEHAGMERSTDRRRTTHVVRQSWPARFAFVPHHTGWHLAHHADMGVPWRNLPRLHDELVVSGWVTEAITWPNYRTFWRAAASRPTSRPA